MTVTRLSTVLPVDELGAAVRQFTELLGTEPTFVDGDRWAQFDIGSDRLSLAGTDRFADHPSVLLKVDDLDATRERLTAQGFVTGELREGAHERRLTAVAPGGWTICFYASR